MSTVRAPKEFISNNAEYPTDDELRGIIQAFNNAIYSVSSLGSAYRVIVQAMVCERIAYTGMASARRISSAARSLRMKGDE